MKSITSILFVLTCLIGYAQTISGCYIDVNGKLSGEDKLMFNTGACMQQIYPTIESSFETSCSGHNPVQYFVNNSVDVKVVNGNGSGPEISIGENITNPFTGTGTVSAWQEDFQAAGFVNTYNIAQYVKRYLPNIIDQYGFFRIKISARCDKNTNQYGWNDWRFELFIATDYHFKLTKSVVCEGSTVNLNSNLSTGSIYYNSPTNYQIAINNCTSGSSLNSNNLSVGQIISDATDSCAIQFNASNVFYLPWASTSSEWFVAQNVRNFDPAVGGAYPVFSGTPLSYQYNGSTMWSVECFDTSRIEVWNNPVINFTSFPSPLYNNAPPLNIESYLSVLYEDWYTMFGPNVTYNTTGGYFEFDPNITQGTHDIIVEATRGACTLEESYPIQVQKWPGTPSTPTLDWIASFDDSTEQASFGSGSPVPCYNNGVFTDCNYYFRHKWLCAGRAADDDSIELFIYNPPLNYNYEWKISIGGFEQFLGQGISMKIPRRNNPTQNLSNVYRETILYRAQNDVGLWSAWEYVNLDYPVYWYPSGATALEKEVPGVVSTTFCHDGNIDVDYFDLNLIEDSVYSGGGFGVVWNSGNVAQTIPGTGVTDYRSYVESQGQFFNEGDIWSIPFLGQKAQYDTIREYANIRRFGPSVYDSIDVCMCRPRDYVIESVKNPEIVTVSVPNTPVNVGFQMNFNTTTNWNGVGAWFIDSNMFSPAFVGNNVNLYATGQEGWHSVYLIVSDTYGCSVDSMVLNAFNVIDYEIDSVDIDTLIYTDPTIDIGINADADVNGGNFIITPNNDGFNDLINILNLNGREYQLNLFNRWGHVVMTFVNGGSALNVDHIDSSTYYYKLELPGKTLTGFIEIKR